MATNEKQTKKHAEMHWERGWTTRREESDSKSEVTIRKPATSNPKLEKERTETDQEWLQTSNNKKGMQKCKRRGKGGKKEREESDSKSEVTIRKPATNNPKLEKERMETDQEWLQTRSKQKSMQKCMGKGGGQQGGRNPIPNLRSPPGSPQQATQNWKKNGRKRTRNGFKRATNKKSMQKCKRREKGGKKEREVEG